MLILDIPKDTQQGVIFIFYVLLTIYFYFAVYRENILLVVENVLILNNLNDFMEQQRIQRRGRVVTDYKNRQ